MTPRHTLLLALLVGLLQIGFLGWTIMSRAAILRDGREVLLRVQPVDPRDLLRGDYVRLGYDIGMLPRSTVANLPSEVSGADGTPVFVRLAKQADGYWQPIAATVGKTPAEAAPPDQVDLRGVLTGYDGVGPNQQAVIGVDYGIERYYVPEGEGREIEKNMATRPFGILLGVAANGTPQIKALMDGQSKLYEEPLY